jgi:hypothetical protein
MTGSKSVACKGVLVRVRPGAPIFHPTTSTNNHQQPQRKRLSITVAVSAALVLDGLRDAGTESLIAETG